MMHRDHQPLQHHFTAYLLSCCCMISVWAFARQRLGCLSRMIILALSHAGLFLIAAAIHASQLGSMSRTYHSFSRRAGFAINKHTLAHILPWVRLQEGPNAVPPVLPPGLTALTVCIFAGVPPYQVTEPVPQLAQLSALRRLDLRFKLHGPEAGCAVLPVLPIGITHLTIGVDQMGHEGDVEPLLRQQVRDPLSLHIASIMRLSQPLVLACGPPNTHPTTMTSVSVSNVPATLGQSLLLNSAPAKKPAIRPGMYSLADRWVLS